MPRTLAASTVLVLYALLGSAVRADDTPRKGEDPDPSFLEFLGSVDGLSEANPDYLAQANAPRPPKPAPPPPSPAPPSGVKNNE